MYVLHARFLRSTSANSGPHAQTATLARSHCASPRRPTRTATLARSLCASPRRPTQTSTSARSQCASPSRPTQTLTLARSLCASPSRLTRELEPCTVTVIMLIPSLFHPEQHLLRRTQGLQGSIDLPRQRPAGHLKTSTQCACAPVRSFVSKVPFSVELGVMLGSTPPNESTLRVFQQRSKIWAFLHALFRCTRRDVFDNHL